jgi:hypothetical protein
MLTPADSLRLSAGSTRQLARMLDDFAFLTYPLHLVVGILKTLLFLLLLVGAIILYLGEWACTARQNRADLIQNFTREQTIYRVNTASGTVSVANTGEFAVDKDTFNSVFTGCLGTDSSLKHTTWFDHDWLNEKSDMFQAGYITASRNIAALRSTLGQVKAGHQDIASFHYACLDAVIYGQSIVIPNAPVVNVAFLRRTERDLEEPANAHNNHFTGVCLASSNCNDADYLPRNDSIYADAIYHQVTANQGAALKALYETGTPEFWIETAHANGIYKDALIASYAAQNKAQLENDLLRHIPTPEEEFIHEAEIAIVCCLLFIGVIGVWIACCTGKQQPASMRSS